MTAADAAAACATACAAACAHHLSPCPKLACGQNVITTCVGLILCCCSAAGSAAVAASATDSASAITSAAAFAASALLLLLVLHFVALFDLPFATAFFRSVRTSFVLLNITFNIFANNCCQGQSWITKDNSTLWEYAKASPLTLPHALPHQSHMPTALWAHNYFGAIQCWRVCAVV